MTDKIEMVDIDDLGIDTCNIRGGEWDYDEELISSVKSQGILEPLLIRPVKNEKVKYGIVAGSRRFNAAIEAGLHEVPCVIRQLDDATAMGISLAENRHSKDIPRWKYIEWVGKMYDRLNGTQEKMKVYEKIHDLTGIGTAPKFATIREYIKIYENLSEDIKELMKEPSERSERVTELLKKSAVTAPDEVLSPTKALMIADKFSGESFERQFELAAAVLPKEITVDRTADIIEQAITYDKKPIGDIIEGVKQEIYREWRGMITLDFNLRQGLFSAAERRQMEIKSLIRKYIEEGLKREGYL